MTGRPARRRRAAGPHGLTPRQVEIVALLMRGHGTKEIADRLYLRPQSVRNAIHRIGVALGVSGRLRIVARARELGIAPADE